MRRRKIIAVAGLCAAGGLAAGGVATAVLGGPGTPSSRPDVSQAGSRRALVARFAAEPGATGRVVVVQRTTDGFVCLWDAPDATSPEGLGGCNPAADPLGGRQLFVNLAYDGGPSAATVHDARLSGLVAPGVAAARVVMSDRSTRPLALSAATVPGSATAYRAFAYRLRPSDLRAGITPTAVAVLDASGSELDRQATGFGQ